MPAESTTDKSKPAQAATPSGSKGGAAPEQSDKRAFRSPKVIAGFVVLVAVLLAADLVIKSWAFEHVAGVPVVLDPQAPDAKKIPYHTPREVVPHVLSLVLTTNTGAVFGSAKGARWLFVAVSFLAIPIVSFLFLRSSAKMYAFHIGLALVLSGAIGNLYDRLMFAAVRDMFLLFPDVPLPFGLAWPNGSRGLYPWIFNFADVALVVGVVLLGILSWHYDRQRQIALKAQD